MAAYAVVKIITPEGVEEFFLPADPRVWYRPRTTAEVVSVRIVGVDSIPEEFIENALMHGWRYLWGRFYPSSSPEDGE